MSNSEASIFISTLESFEGVGKVTARKVLSNWSTLQDFRRFPKEQALVRLKGVAKASELIDKLNDIEFMKGKMEEQSRHFESLSARQINLSSFLDDNWPAGLDSLTDYHGPNLLYSYGNRAVFKTKHVSIITKHGVTGESHEFVQKLVRYLLENQMGICTSMNNGMDVVLQKINYDRPIPLPSLMTASYGLAKTPKEYRPQVSKGVQGGGLFFSPFEVSQGPFDHDLGEAHRIQIGVSSVVVFVEPAKDNHALELMKFASAGKRAVFYIGDRLPDNSELKAEHISDDKGLEWVLVTANSL